MSVGAFRVHVLYYRRIGGAQSLATIILPLSGSISPSFVTIQWHILTSGTLTKTVTCVIKSSGSRLELQLLSTTGNDRRCLNCYMRSLFSATNNTGQRESLAQEAIMDAASDGLRSPQSIVLKYFLCSCQRHLLCLSILHRIFISFETGFTSKSALHHGARLRCNSGWWWLWRNFSPPSPAQTRVLCPALRGRS